MDSPTRDVGIRGTSLILRKCREFTKVNLLFGTKRISDKLIFSLTPITYLVNKIT